jgi:3-hydroxyacyl-[acyl-carrier-protein] dehydratase
MELDVKAIEQIIPHRYPMLMLDRVTEVIPDKKVVAVKNVSVNEPFFVGHFPEEKIMPGVLVTEAMAQAACVYYYYSQRASGKKFMYYLGKINIQFMELVRPGDQLRIEITEKKITSQLGYVLAKASVGSKTAAEGEIIFSVKAKA